MSRKPNITLNHSCIYALVSQDILPGQDVDALNVLEAWHQDKKLTIWVSQRAKTKALLDMEQIQYQEKLGGVGRYQQWVEVIKLLESFAVFGRQSKGSKVSQKQNMALGNRNEFQAIRQIEDLIPGEQDLIEINEIFEHYSQNNDLYICNQIEKLPHGRKVVESLKDQLAISICSPGYAVGVLRNDFGVI